MKPLVIVFILACAVVWAQSQTNLSVSANATNIGAQTTTVSNVPVSTKGEIFRPTNSILVVFSEDDRKLLQSANSTHFIKTDTLINTLFGALLAVGVGLFADWYRERRKRQTEQFGGIVRSQMVLVSQLNTASNIKKQHLDRFRNDSQREFKLILFQMTGAPLRVDYNAISFLLTTHNAQLVLEVQAAEQCYFSAMEALEVRNHAYEKLHQNSELQQFDIKTGHTSIRPKDLRDVKLLKDRTDSLYVAVDRACEALALQIEELYKAGKAIYPKKQFLKIIGEKASVENS